jgi:uncharacterized membrane protein YjjP (DUF1212 family)
MASVARTALALLAVLLIAIALALMTSGDLMLAGLNFLAASLVIYLRETRFAGE